MLKIKNVSLRALSVSLRWARMKGFPSNLKIWTEEQNTAIQNAAMEYDRRHPQTNPFQVKSMHWED